MNSESGTMRLCDGMIHSETGFLRFIVSIFLQDGRESLFIKLIYYKTTKAWKNPWWYNDILTVLEWYKMWTKQDYWRKMGFQIYLDFSYNLWNLFGRILFLDKPKQAGKHPILEHPNEREWRKLRNVDSII